MGSSPFSNRPRRRPRGRLGIEVVAKGRTDEGSKRRNQREGCRRPEFRVYHQKTAEDEGRRRRGRFGQQAPMGFTPGNAFLAPGAIGKPLSFPSAAFSKCPNSRVRRPALPFLNRSRWVQSPG